MPEMVSSPFSRRKLLIAGLGGTVLAASVGGWLLAARRNTPIPPAVPPTPAPVAGTPLFVYSGHRAPVFSVAWSPDSKYIASVSVDRTIQIWNATSNAKAIITYKVPGFGISSVAWSPDSRRLASGGLDNVVRIWDALYGSGVHSAYSGHIG